MSEETKPVDTTPAAEPASETKPAETPAPAEASTAAAETKPTEEAPKTEEGAAAPAAEEAKPAKKEVKPITAGSLRYKAPANFPKNLLNTAHELYFWFGEEAVEVKKLSSFLSKATTDYAHNAAAWSSQTGKGLLYYAKNKDQKDAPAGVLPLAEVSDIATVGTTEFTFKLGGHKHVFITSGEHEREGWLKALKPEAEAASGKKEEIHGSEGFKKALEELKPAVVASSVAPKKSTEERAPREENGTKEKSKSRSVSRGKRGSIFDRLSGKKEESKEEPAKKEEPATEAAAPATTEAAPAETTETPATATESAAAAPPAEEAKKEEPKAEESKEEPKTSRRASKFGDFFKKVTSPTHEKKEAEVAPAAPAVKEPEAPAAESSVAPAATAGATEETPAADKPAEKAAEATTPTKEKKKFFDVGKLFPKEKAKSPTTEEAPKTEEAPATETAAETAAAEPSAPAAETTEAPVATETPAVNGENKAAEHKDKRRSSFFTGDFAGSIKKLGGHKEKKAEPAKTEPVTDGEPAKVDEAKPVGAEATKTAEPEKKKEHKENPLTKLGRRVSTAVRGGQKKEKEAASPAKVEETAEAGEPSTSEAPKIEEPAKEEKKEEAKPETPAAPQAIGDVVPEAVNIGSTPPASSTVQAAA